jgi:YD repeat-containing protein
VTYDRVGDPLQTKQLDTDGSTVLAATSATYDAAGNVLSMTDARGHTSTFVRDPLGRVTAEVQPVDDMTSITTSFGYDADGHRTRFTDGRGNRWIYTYNAMSLPESVIEPATATYSSAADSTFTTAYDAAGRPVTQTAPGGVTVATGYDELGDVTDQSGSGADTATASRSFSYDGDGRLLTGQVDEAARASKHDDVKAAILILRGDINQIVHAIKTKKAPSEQLLAKLQQDGDAVDSLCTF